MRKVAHELRGPLGTIQTSLKVALGGELAARPRDMAIAYGMAARNLVRNRPLVLFSIIAKAVATVFLLTYYFAVDDKWIVLLSAIGDGLMCLAVYFGYRPRRCPAGQGT